MFALLSGQKLPRIRGNLPREWHVAMWGEPTGGEPGKGIPSIEERFPGPFDSPVATPLDRRP